MTTGFSQAAVAAHALDFGRPRLDLNRRRTRRRARDGVGADGDAAALWCLQRAPKHTCSKQLPNGRLESACSQTLDLERVWRQSVGVQPARARKKRVK